MSKISIYISTLFLLWTFSLKAQETEHEKNKHAISVVLSHANISRGVQNGKTKWQSFPSWGLNYNFTVSDKWLIGWHNDIIVEDFVVEEHLKNETNSSTLKRSYPLASLAVVTYKIKRHFGVLGGFGGEFAHEGNLGVVRIGVEFPFHIPNNFEIFVNAIYDMKVNAYDTWNLGFGIAKLF